MKFLTSVLLVLMLAGCATSYQKKGFTGGWSETQLDENLFRVNFQGNGYTSSQRAWDFALLRSAELALDNNYKYFILLGQDSVVNNSSYTTQTTSRTTGNAYATGNNASFSATTYSTGGNTYNIAKPSSANTVLCFKEKPAHFSYDAQFIYKSITAKYDIVK